MGGAGATVHIHGAKCSAKRKTKEMIPKHRSDSDKLRVLLELRTQLRVAGMTGVASSARQCLG